MKFWTSINHFHWERVREQLKSAISFYIESHTKILNGSKNVWKKLSLRLKCVLQAKKPNQINLYSRFEFTWTWCIIDKKLRVKHKNYIAQCKQSTDHLRIGKILATDVFYTSLVKIISIGRLACQFSTFTSKIQI